MVKYSKKREHIMADDDIYNTFITYKKYFKMISKCDASFTFTG